ncbi:transposase [Endozoicomonas sp.]|nr:transposase [Endozoicomonas sp.]
MALWKLRIQNNVFVFVNLPLTTREWICSECKTRHDRDINAVKNIRTGGVSLWSDWNGDCSLAAI